MDLKELLGEELYNQVIAKAAGKKIDVVTDRYIPLDKFNEVNNELKQQKQTVADRDKQLKDLSKDSEASEQLKAKITELEATNTANAEKYAAEINAIKLSTAIRSAIGDKAHNAASLEKLLDTSKLSLAEDGTVKGLDDQVKALKESDSYLFKPEQPAPKATPPGIQGAVPGQGSPGSGGSPASNAGEAAALAANARSAPSSGTPGLWTS